MHDETLNLAHEITNHIFDEIQALNNAKAGSNAEFKALISLPNWISELIIRKQKEERANNAS